MPRRPSDFNLKRAITDSGFTPAQRDVPALLGLFTDGAPEVRDPAERALRRAGSVVLAPAIERATSGFVPGGARAPASGRAAVSQTARGRLVTLIARIAGAEPPSEVRSFLLGALSDADAGVRRRAAAGLGRAHARDEEVESALAAAAAKEADAPARAAMIEALGKLGGGAANAALAALAAAPAAKDEKSQAALRKARVRAARPEAREAGSRVDPTRDVGRPVTRVWLDCRRGMLPVLLEEAASFRPRVEHRIDGSMVAEIALQGPLASLFASRTWSSMMLPGGVERIVGRDRVRAAALAIAFGPAREAAAALTPGPLRYRLAWASGGKRRATVYAIAESVAALDRAQSVAIGPQGAPNPSAQGALINDPTDAAWQVIVREAPDRVGVEWIPSIDDPRFAYRQGDVPAASHPTIAAALAYLAGANGEDVVWDPFVGSGLELCERSRRGAYARLVGTDVDPAALDVARKNLTACGADRFDLAVHDAALGAPPGVRPTLVITNPPMGRRVHRSADLRGVLAGFVAAAARSLAPRGRFVWVSPFAADMRAAAEANGLSIRRAHVIDLGGFDAEIQVWVKGA